MTAASQNIWLQTCLKPLEYFLGRENVTDLYINRPGEIWIEALGKQPYRELAPELTASLLTRLAGQIAAVSSQGVSREHPLLAASLPSGERVQIIMPPATRGHLALAIRKQVSAGLRLDAYRDASSTKPEIGSIDDGLARTGWAGACENDAVQLLRDTVARRKNILVAGGTSSGKTTFVNALLHEIPPDERLIVIEDTPELELLHGNVVGLLAVRGKLGEAEVTPEDLLIASLRMRPDRIILGELRGAEAMTFLRAINSGHPGSLSTIHADSPEGAIDQLVMLALQAGSRMRWEDIDRYVRKTVDVIVQLERRDGERRISRILLPQ